MNMDTYYICHIIYNVRHYTPCLNNYSKHEIRYKTINKKCIEFVLIHTDAMVIDFYKMVSRSGREVLLKAIIDTNQRQQQ